MRTLSLLLRKVGIIEKPIIIANMKKNSNDRIENRAPAYQSIVKENEKFEKYYQAQNVCESSEWESFITTLKTDLPASFRITGSKNEASKLLKIIEDQFIQECVSKRSVEAGETNDIFPLPWYPDRLAWQLNLTRNDIRRNEAYYKLHSFLISENENGTISRQETVSMIPPLLLDVKPHHKVLDMCAAPGSKTAQILELLHAGDEAIPSGYLIANDVDNKRCYMLVHQAKRLNSPCIAITNHDSAFLPNMVCTVNGSTQKVEFDRVLCDVPCSGDGTLRKNPDIWMKWTPANALNLHGIQYRILKRGVDLLTVGGRLVYSTCSINPIENEAVISRVLSESNGALRVIDVGSCLPGLKYSPGMKHWRVSSRNLEFYESFEEVDEKWRTTIRPEMFPPSKDEAEKLGLEKCLRLLPHHQNTGAFFVAVIEKVKSINYDSSTINNKKYKAPSDPILDSSVASTSVEEFNAVKRKQNFSTQKQGKRRKTRRGDVFKEDPFIFFSDNEEVWTSIKEFYEVSDAFDDKCLLTRCHTGKKKNIYLTSSGLRDLVNLNQETIKFINMGVKTFVRCDNKNMRCAFRIANDGLSSVYPFIGKKRIVQLGRSDLVVLLLNVDPAKSPQIDTLSQPVQDQVSNLSSGSCVLKFEDTSEDDDPLIIYLSGWRGKTTLRCYLTQYSVVHFLRLLGEDVSSYVVNKFKQNDSEGNCKGDD